MPSSSQKLKEIRALFPAASEHDRKKGAVNIVFFSPCLDYDWEEGKDDDFPIPVKKSGRSSEKTKADGKARKCHSTYLQLCLLYHDSYFGPQELKG